MRCIVCNESNWENVDRYRIKQFKDGAKKKPMGMSICTSCGFISYPDQYKTKKEMLDFYRHEYRSRPPGAMNLFQAERKLGYHEAFLGPYMHELASKERKPRIVDVGCAIGVVPSWLRSVFDEGADIYGVELTVQQRRVAYYAFRTETFEQIKEEPHDLIMSYKCAEHQCDADKELEKYAELLKPDGRLYISVPTWFNIAENFGAGGPFSLEFYYDPAHINVWTREHFEYVLAKSGFEIIERDHLIYNDTYLCKRNDDMKKKTMADFKIPSVENIKDAMSRLKVAYQNLDQRKWNEALEQYPLLPMGWFGLYEQSRNELHRKGWEEIEAFWSNAIKTCRGHLDVVLGWADVLMRYNKFDQALNVLRMVKMKRPRSGQIFLQEANCLREMAKNAPNENKKNELLHQAMELMNHVRQLSAETIAPALDWAYSDAAQLPTPQEIKEEEEYVKIQSGL